MSGTWFNVNLELVEGVTLTLERQKEVLAKACDPNSNEVEIVTDNEGKKSLVVFVTESSLRPERDIARCLERLARKNRAEIYGSDFGELEPTDLAPGEWDRIVNQSVV